MAHLRQEDPDTTAAYAGAVAKDLVALRSPAAVERHVLASVIRYSGADWAALYRPQETDYRRSSVEGAAPAELPVKLTTEAVEEALSDGADVNALTSGDEAIRSVDICLRAGLASELDVRPILLLVGPPPGGRCEDLAGSALQPIADVCGQALRNADLIERLSSQVFLDFITGAFNRRAFEEHLAVELERARRYGRPLSILLLDLDGFKAVNDTYGHAVGDDVLQRVADVLRSAFRTSDRVCRFGGDEFAVIFPETSKADVVRLAERLRRQVEATWSKSDNAYAITASIGVATYPRDAARLEDLVRTADRALYRAKTEGRNQVASA